jgi:hypothetical protein
MSTIHEVERQAMNMAGMPKDSAVALNTLRDMIINPQTPAAGETSALLDRISEGGGLMLVFVFGRDRSHVAILTLPQLTDGEEHTIALTTNSIPVRNHREDIRAGMEKILDTQHLQPVPVTFSNVVILEKNPEEDEEHPLRIGRWLVHTAQQHKQSLYYNSLIHDALSS